MLSIYLLILQISVCKSVCLQICHSICLYLAYLANLSHDRLRVRPVCCTGPENVHRPVRGCFDASNLYILMSFCAVHSLTFTFYRPPFAGCVLVARWRIWAPGGQHITIETNLCVRLRGRPSFYTQMSAHTPTDHTLNGHMH